VSERIKFEIKGRDEFWARAFLIEWEHRFPNRKLLCDQAGSYSAESDWELDIGDVARQTFCQVIRAPRNPQRRRWIESLIPSRDL
jgi:hypothetical protein